MTGRSPTRATCAKRRRCASHRSFTLVEMIVTIGIIVILTALTVSATVALVQKSEVGQTESILRLLDMAVQEWEASADRKITWGVPGTPNPLATYDMHDGVPHVYTISEVFNRIGKSGEVRTILAQIQPEFLYTYDTTQAAPVWIAMGIPGDPDINADSAAAIYSNNDLYGDGSQPVTGLLTALDTWGTPIRAVHPGRLHSYGPPFNDIADPDLDGTLHLDQTTSSCGVEEFYGVCKSRRICFISAGPDGRFGSRSPMANQQRHDEALDNIYSYELDSP